MERPADFTIFRISDFLVKNIHGVFSLIFYALSEKVKTPLTKQLEMRGRSFCVLRLPLQTLRTVL